MGNTYDFAGYVTKNDILCSDGVVIKQNAFKASNGKKVPLVWNHNYNTPSNVLGYVQLKQTDKGTYGYGFFNDSEDAMHAKEMVRHGDITSMSIGANKIKRNGNDVVHGNIYEVSLVLAGANPGAIIDSVISQSDDGYETDILYTGQLIHSSDDIVKEDQEMGNEKESTKEVTLEDVLQMSDDEIDEFINGLDEEQLDQLANEIGISAEQDDTNDEESEENNEESDEPMKHNIFDTNENDSKISYEDQALLLQSAIADKADSFKDYLLQAEEDQVGGTDFGITNIEQLFPDVHNVTQAPLMSIDQNTSYKVIVNGVSKTPFSRIKSRYFDIDINDEKQRARGYAKGNRKTEEVIKVLHRETYPATIYKKQKLDRDDIIEITDFDVVAALNSEMRTMLEIELARAILIGDGRVEGDDKIDEEKIRPIAKDDEVYTITAEFTSPEDFAENLIFTMGDYEGSGKPTLFIDPKLLAKIKLLKGTDKRYLFNHIPTNQELATMYGVSNIVETSFLKDKNQAIVVNLKDYVVGSTKGGQLTTFSDFDIDFNRYKYLIETRLSGALVVPKSAIVLTGSEKVPSLEE